MVIKRGVRKKVIFFAFTFLIGNALSADFFKLNIPGLVGDNVFQDLNVPDLFGDKKSLDLNINDFFGGKKSQEVVCGAFTNYFTKETYNIKENIDSSRLKRILTQFEPDLKTLLSDLKDLDSDLYSSTLAENLADLEETIMFVKKGTSAPFPPNASKEHCDIFNKVAENKYKLSKIKHNEEKVRKEKEKKKEEARKEKEKLERLTNLKKNRDNRGKYGVSFNMTKNDLPDYCETKYQITNFGTSYKERVFCDLEDRNFEVQFGQNFVDVIKRDIGEYSHSESRKIVKTLKNRYKLIKEPSMADKEKFFLADYGNVHFFENESGFDSSAGVFDKQRGPKYIEFSVTTDKNYDAIMYLYYYSTHHFEENILPKINKEKNKLNDI